MNEEAVVGSLRACSLNALLMLTAKVLSRIGLGDIELLDRRKSRQKSRYGGHELVCYSEVGGLPVKVIVKVIRDDIRLRMLDEIAGAVQRTKADFGLVVSPFTVTANALRYQAAYASSRIETIDGSSLARLLKKANLGLRTHGEPDYAFFGELEQASKTILDRLTSQP